MKTYIVEDKIINLKTKEILIFFIGKDGYVHSFIECCEGYTRKVYAEKLIKKELNEHYMTTKLDDNHGLEGKKWLHIYRVVEYEKKGEK